MSIITMVATDQEITSGVTVDPIEKEILFDYKKDSDEDVIHLVDIVLKESEIFDHTYLYGYEFTPKATRDQRKIFVDALREYPQIQQVHDFPKSVTLREFQRFIERPLNELGSGKHKFNVVIYPQSKSDLNKNMFSYMVKTRCTRSNGSFHNFEIIKRTVSEIYFDFNQYLEKRKDSKENYTEVELGIWEKSASKYFDRDTGKIKDIHGIFAIGELPKKLRPFVKSFLYFPEEEYSRVKTALNDSHILILDDTKVSGTTIHEIIAIIQGIVESKSITVFTLLRNDLDVELDVKPVERTQLSSILKQ
jgi:hypothetical protein